jgi:hypothetical protein
MSKSKNDKSSRVPKKISHKGIRINRKRSKPKTGRKNSEILIINLK